MVNLSFKLPDYSITRLPNQEKLHDDLVVLATVDHDLMPGPAASSAEALRILNSGAPFNVRASKLITAALSEFAAEGVANHFSTGGV